MPEREVALDAQEMRRLLNAGKPGRALSLAHESCTRFPQSPDAHHQLSLVLLELARYDEAIGSLSRVVSLDPGRAQAWLQLGACYGQSGQLDRAVECSKRVIALQPGNVDAHFNLAQSCMHKGDYRNAALAYEEVLRLNPAHMAAYDNLAFAYRKLGKFAEVVVCREKMVELDRGNGERLADLGNALHDAGRYDEARASFEQALSLRPDLSTVRFMLSALSGREVPGKPPAEYVSNLFDGFADTFDESLTEHLGYRTPDFLHRLVAGVLDRQPGDCKLLDLGCGTGLCGPLFREMAGRMTGIDLSPKMIEKAQAREVYDELLVGDIAGPDMDRFQEHFDIVLSADVFPYIGDLEEVFDACKRILRKGGLFAFSTEAAGDDAPYILRESNRYAHSAAYVRAVAAGSGFSELAFEQAVLRKDRGKPIHGYLFVVRLDQ